MRGGGLGDLAVRLPDSAISSAEILDEPGIAVGASIEGDTLSYSMEDILVHSITIPAPRYIHVTARCNAFLQGTTSPRGGLIQIDETAGGSVIHGQYASIWVDSSTVTELWDAIPLYVDATFYKSSEGTYTFRIEGYQLGAGIVSIWQPRMTLLYFPTSYGTVETITRNPGDNPSARAVAFDGDSLYPDVGQLYEVDLRYYELKAKAAQEAAEQAQRELEQQRLRNRRR